MIFSEFRFQEMAIPLQATGGVNSTLTSHAFTRVKGMYPAPDIHEHFTIHKWLRQTAYILTHNMNNLEHIANNCTDTTQSTLTCTMRSSEHAAHRLLMHMCSHIALVAQGLALCVIHIIHACAPVFGCLSVFSLHPSLYFFLKSFFQLFLMSTLMPDEISMEDPLCDSSFGSMVTLDYVTPDTTRANVPRSHVGSRSDETRVLVLQRFLCASSWEQFSHRSHAVFRTLLETPFTASQSTSTSSSLLFSLKLNSHCNSAV